jgi:hypothetical protein
MTRLTLQQAWEELKKLFVENGVKFKSFNENENKEENTSFISENTFMIDKKHLDRWSLISLLQDFFQDKCIIDGGCSIGAITLVWTDVTLFDKEHPLKNE